MLRLAYRVVLLTSALLLFLCVWILIPPPHQYLLPLAVGSPELSPGLLAAALLLAVVSSARARRLGVARLALVFALVAACLALVPLIQLRLTLRRFDQVMGAVPLDQKAGMRSRAFVLADLFRPPAPGDAQVTRGLEFAKPDGVPLTLDLYYPVAAGTFPVLVQVYGGAWQRGAPSDDEWFARYFAARNYLVVAIDYRHAPQWKWPEQLEDVRSSLRWVAEHAVQYNGDPSRIALIGRSSGGHLATRVAYQEATSAIRAVVSFYGPVDLEAGWRQPPQPDPLNVRTILETFVGGTPDQMPDRYRHASPITYASGRVPPTLLFYGSRDHVVEARFGRMLDEALRKSGNTSLLLELPWSEHAFDVLPNGLGGQVSLYYTERFLAWALR